MPEIKLQKRLPNLTPEEETIFCEAINEAYLRGKADGKPKWIPVSERLPKKSGDYLVAKQLFSDSYVRVVSFAKDGRKISKYDFHNRWKNVWYEYHSEYGYIPIDSVTHWMPLPEAPKGE